MAVGFREFDFSEADYAAHVAVENSAWPERKTDLASARNYMDRWDPKFRCDRYLMEIDGEAVGYGRWGETSWSPRPGKYFMEWGVKAGVTDAASGEFGEFLWRCVVATGDANTVCMETRENRGYQVDWLVRRGWKIVHREEGSQCDAQTFDPSPFAEQLAAFARRGYEVRSLAALRSSHEDWLERIHDVAVEIVEDLPAPEPVKPESLEIFAKRFDSPGHSDDAFFVAVDGDRWMGLSAMLVSEVEPHKLWVVLTGVRRAYRRQSVCTALKVRGLEWARAKGYRVVVTENEENNPMFQINLALGFRPTPAWVVFQIEL
jgi:GNAT superfamily N-acetyltransferase